MSVTGPGCERCNFLGVVDWQDQPFTNGAHPFNYKPCDHCGGYSQFKGAANRAAEAEAIVERLHAWGETARPDPLELNKIIDAARAFVEARR